MSIRAVSACPSPSERISGSGTSETDGVPDLPSPLVDSPRNVELEVELVAHKQKLQSETITLKAVVIHKVASSSSTQSEVPDGTSAANRVIIK